MFEIAQNFEQVATHLSPIVLIGAGVVCMLLGLLLWLGGLMFGRVLFAVIGAVGGGICGFFLTGQHITPAVLFAGLAAAVAAMFEKIFVTILVSALAMSLGLVILAYPYIENTDSLRQYPEYEASNRTAAVGISESVEIIKTSVVDFGAAIRQGCSQIPASKWAIVAALGVVFMGGGFCFSRLASALCCAMLGTTLIFAGMILLLLYKAAMPVSDIGNKQAFYAVVFLAMTGFGTIEQLLLLQFAGKKPTKRKPKDRRNRDVSDETAQNWRTA
jgi:hypothetical protein